MSDCCDPIPYRRFFNTKEATRRLKNYRKRGIDSMAESIVGHLEVQGIDGMSVLEVGGGVGDVQIELLKLGAESAVNLELSDAYGPAAKELADEAGFGERMTQRFGDFVEMQDDVEPADIVLLNRVVCCYPFVDPMMRAAVAKTNRHLALVFPRERWGSKVGIAMSNKLNSWRGCEFRAFVHPVDDIEAVATRSGLEAQHRHRNFVWQAVVFSRAA